jgi:hypothetical protein
MFADVLGPLLCQFLRTDASRNVNLSIGVLLDQQSDKFLALPLFGARDKYCLGFHALHNAIEAYIYLIDL